jgi:hypothetical protein
MRPALSRLDGSLPLEHHQLRLVIQLELLVPLAPRPTFLSCRGRHWRDPSLWLYGSTGSGRVG